MTDEILTGLREIDRAQNPISDALDKLGSGEGVDLTVEDRNGQIAATAEASKYVGRGWSIAAAGSWAKSAGYTALGKLTWKPKP